MTRQTIQPVILCGGSGTRLWPRSRKAKPKPFLPLVGDRTLFQETFGRWLEQDDLPNQSLSPDRRKSPTSLSKRGLTHV
jgi:mannose-1-phosphate guanylyltransferase